MAIYNCSGCLQLIDDDYEPCMESPENGELVCPDCYDRQYDHNHCQNCDKKTEKLLKGLCEVCNA